MNETTTPTTQHTPKNAFIVRVKKGRKEAIQHGVIGIGWSKIDGMNQFHGMSRDQLKNRIQDAYEEPLSSRALGNVAGSIERFCSMAVGDYVLMPVGRGFHLGIVKSEVKRCDEGWASKTHLQWQRDVCWLTKEKSITRSTSDNSLQKRLKVRQTCVDVSKFIFSINESFNPSPKPSFLDRVRKDPTKDGVIDAFRFLNDSGLEKLIKCLCQADGGANAKVLPKKSKDAGDADVSCEYIELSDAAHVKSIISLYQVKRHEKRSGHHGVQQVIDRINALKLRSQSNDQKVYRGYFVTTALHVTEKATKCAAQHAITIVARDDLVKWILKHQNSLTTHAPA